MGRFSVEVLGLRVVKESVPINLESLKFDSQLGEIKNVDQLALENVVPDTTTTYSSSK